MNGQQGLDLPGLDDQPIWVVRCTAGPLDWLDSKRMTRANAEKLLREIAVLGACSSEHTVEIAHGPTDRAETDRNEGDD